MMTFSSEFLQAVVDTLLPGLPATEQAPALPAASQVGIDKVLAKRLRSHPKHAEIVEALQAIIREAGTMSAFIAMSSDMATRIIQGLESSHPEAFKALLFIVSADYYESKAVIEAFNWPTTPPQPTGYPLLPFQDHLLDPVRQRPPLWRSDKLD